ncbi:phosphotransferase family enzyme [Kribbella voronezhensis]|uniref:Phosphotransferase family enzyme n=1 Tax=Kribbella voronezhensis TaxID=2512212 RepID=A0A4R7T6P0_9ACTN|nr:aminoglycoside phosphotransferase family protein [Kribbella voronezhensis]TDU86758.1 phosphotransferase family enzyme [Kribbella voronezhensis]
MTWTPPASWRPLTSGTGQSNAGVWLTPDQWVVKRLAPGVEDRRHHAYWRRQPLLAESDLVAATPGLRSPACHKVEWDDEGATIWTAHVRPDDPTSAPDPLALAAALGRFARAHVAEPSWGARDVLRDRLTTVTGRGGWSALSDAELPSDLRHAVQELWVRRDAALAELDALPRVPTHGDAHPGNLLGRDGDDVIAVDWEQFGLGPTGFDLGYLLLAVDVPFDDLLAAFAPDNPHAVRRGAVLAAAYTAASRAAWSLTQSDPGDHLDRLIRLGDLVAEACPADRGRTVR